MEEMNRKNNKNINSYINNSINEINQTQLSKSNKKRIIPILSSYYVPDYAPLELEIQL
jgi:hypothetical protein